MQKKSIKIITLCADKLISEAFKSIIIACGYEHFTEKNYSLLIEKIKFKKIDLVLMDEIILVDGKKESSVNILKNYKEDIPVLLAISKENKQRIDKEIINYVSKPINIGALKQLVEPHRAYVESKLSDTIKLNEHTYNINQRTLELSNGSFIRFTNYEAALIYIFIQNYNKSLSARFLIEKILGYSSKSDSNTLKTHIWRLRKKLDNKNLNLDIVNLNEGYVLQKK